MRSISLSLLVLGSLFLTSCADSWLVGKWEVDREATMAASNAQMEAEKAQEGKGGFLGEIVGGLKKGISSALVSAMEDTTIEFTSTEFRKTSGGVGAARSYEVIERPSSTERVLKFSDGEIATWAKSGSGIKRKLSSDHDLWIYFTKAP